MPAVIPMAGETQPALLERRLDPSAHALSIFRVLPGGEARAYTAVTFPKDPWQGCEHFLRMARLVGWLREPADDDYGVLDVLDDDASIVQDFGIPDARAFQAIKRKLNLAVESTDAD